MLIGLRATICQIAVWEWSPMNDLVVSADLIVNIVEDIYAFICWGTKPRSPWSRDMLHDAEVYFAVAAEAHPRGRDAVDDARCSG